MGTDRERNNDEPPALLSCRKSLLGVRGAAIRSLAADAEPSVCMCLTHRDVPVEEGDHSICRLEVLACSEHRFLYQQQLDETSIDLEEALSLSMDAAQQLKFELKHLYLEQVVFAGLTNSNNGIDSPLIFHFTPQEFSKVIDRCERLHVRITGAEIFSTDVEPPWKAAFLDIEGFPGEDHEWARRLIKRYLSVPHITLAGFYDVPDSVLQSSGVASGPRHAEKWQVRALALEKWASRKREGLPLEGEIGTE